MNRYLYLFILLFAAVISKAQTFPYLNASTGNAGQYIVDDDTNTIMFHESIVRKTDKHFGTLWAKKYTGLDFYSMLRSKTGSIYFIAKDTVDHASMNLVFNKYVGKIDNAGNLSWIKTIENPSLADISINQLVLNYNNEIVISGEATSLNFMNEYPLLTKLDTLGNMLFFKTFESGYMDIKKVTIVGDSMGYYKCAFGYNIFENCGIGSFVYSEPLDSIIRSNGMGEYPQHIYINYSSFHKSKYEPNTYYSIEQHTGQGLPGQHYSIKKHINDIVVWNKILLGPGGSATYISNLEEDPNKNLMFTISPDYNGFKTGFYTYAHKIDSNGIFNGKRINLSLSWWPPSSLRWSIRLHRLFGNTFFYDICENNSTTRPLKISLVDTSLTNCIPRSVVTMTNGSIGFPSGGNHFNAHPTSFSPYALLDKTSPVADLTLLIDTTYCLSQASYEKINKNDLVTISPNPSTQFITINIASEMTLESYEIYDIKSCRITFGTNPEIKVSSFPTGMYFIKIKTDKGEFSQKFIKE